MTAEMIYGSNFAAEIRKEIKDKICISGLTPRLAILSCGNDAASNIYIKKKIEACEKVGIKATHVLVDIGPPDQRFKWNLMRRVQEISRDCNFDAMILQLPLPAGFNPVDYFSWINPLKDVDVFHPENVGLLMQGRPRFKPCTPHGIQILLHKSGIKVAGKNLVIINRSNTVGKPLSSMLIQECDEYANATVTVCHDCTPPELLKSITKAADIIIVAVGKPSFLKKDMVSEGVGVVDVGISRIDGKIVGDVDHEVYDIAEWATPVPNGVGPMTVCMLLENTLQAAIINSQD